MGVRASAALITGAYHAQSCNNENHSQLIELPMNQQSLSQVAPGQRVRLVSIQGDRVLTRRLLALGLSVGNEVEVLHRRNGDVVVGKEGNRLALGHNIADRVLIEELS